jgi:hypothetical protein
MQLGKKYFFKEKKMGTFEIPSIVALFTVVLILLPFMTLLIGWLCGKEKIIHLSQYGIILEWLFFATVAIAGVNGFLLSDTVYKGLYHMEQTAKESAKNLSDGQKETIETLKKSLEEKGSPVLNLPTSFSGTLYEGSLLHLNDDIELKIIPEQYKTGDKITLTGEKGELKLNILEVSTPAFKRDWVKIIATYTPKSIAVEKK